MNSSQKLGLFVFIAISVIFVYLSFFGKDFKLPDFNTNRQETPEYNPVNNQEEQEPDINTKSEKKRVKLFVLDKSGNLRSVYRECDTEVQKSCFEYAIKELVKAPTKWEKSKGFTSEIPSGTKVLSVRESANSIMIDLSSDFETGGGAESTYMRVKQIIKTANSNSSTPTYLYINGRQTNVIGGEGIMIKQPLNERSLDD